MTGIWYYENESLAAQEGALDDKQLTRYPVCTALQAAFGKGFGTIAFSSLIVAVCEFLKAMARREGRNGGLIGCVVALCIQARRAAIGPPAPNPPWRASCEARPSAPRCASTLRIRIHAAHPRCASMREGSRVGGAAP